MRLKGKTALISGASRNNGRTMALTFAREGADVILLARQLGAELNQVARECEAFGVQALPLLTDVSDPIEVERVVKVGLDRFGKVDVLLCAASIRPHRHFWEFSADEWLQGFAVNLHSTFYLAKALAPGMMTRKGGSIIALGGLASLTAPTLDPIGMASKHGLYGLIKALALELGPYGVRANLLALSFIYNERRNPEWYPGTGGKHTAEEIARTPLRREGTLQEVANVALFLASEESSYITGDRIVCAGGRYM